MTLTIVRCYNSNTSRKCMGRLRTSGGGGKRCCVVCGAQGVMATTMNAAISAWNADQLEHIRRASSWQTNPYFLALAVAARPK